MNRIFVGYDPRQLASYTVLCSSIVRRTRQPVSIAPIGTHNTECTREGLTPFTYARFLVPMLCDYRGWALFLDADILVRDDINELFSLADDRAAVMVVRNKIRLEWASVMLFNCGHPENKRLTPALVNSGGAALHSIGWTHLIGDLPPEWNHLVGYDPPNPNAKLAHYTRGVPAWPETRGCELADEWRAELASCSGVTATWQSLMGRSIHGRKRP